MEKGSAIRDMFGRIAARYDIANDVMSVGMCTPWRWRAQDVLAPADDARLLDLCCGTGASTAELAKLVPHGHVVGVDFTPAMLEVARTRRALPNVEYIEADVLRLPFEDDTFDGAMMQYSLRNVVDIEAALRETARVLKPGAPFVNLDMNKPPNPMWRALFTAYFFNLVPLLGRAIAGDAAAYRYLPESLVNFPEPDGLARLFVDNGFEHVRYVRLMGGIAAIHVGYRPRPLGARPAVEFAAVEA